MTPALPRSAATDDRLAALRHAIVGRIEQTGIAFAERDLPPCRPAEFDGISISLSTRQPHDWQCWYLAHTFASVAGWCLDLDGVGRMYDELRDAKETTPRDPHRLDRAVEAFRRFETLVSCYSTWLLADLGHAWAIDPFTLFFRADLEAMTTFHRAGRAPVWAPFLDQFAADVRSGRRPLDPFPAIQMPSFAPARFATQQVTQETGSDA